jgi:hypothetical protein
MIENIENLIKEVEKINKQIEELKPIAIKATAKKFSRASHVILPKHLENKEVYIIQKSQVNKKKE